jgi:hypothetical protein
MSFINDIDLFGEPVSKKKKVRKTKEDEIHDRTASLLELWTRLPDKLTSQHIISDGTFDFYSFVPAALQMQKTGFDEFLGTTWLMNQPISTDLVARYDSGEIRKIELIVGRYLKARTPGVYGFLKNASRERENMRVKEGRIHAKIILLANYDTDTFLTIEGSANFTGNPRTEQYIVMNNMEVYNHHKQWIDEFRW